jgi:sugar O-acyltransferase (sialic acid O-acetyltransferase NeuD family)
MKSMKKRGPAVWVLGAGGHARVVVSTLRAAGFLLAGVLDDDRRAHGKDFMGEKVRGPLGLLEEMDNPQAVVAIGGNEVRRDVQKRFPGVEWIRLVHPAATVDPTVELGPGTVVFAGVVIQVGAVLGRHCIVNTAASIDHDCVVGDFAHVAPGCHLAGGVRLGPGVLMGTGSAAIPSVRVGAWTTVGAGAVVVRDIAGGVKAVGVPARAKKTRRGR